MVVIRIDGVCKFTPVTRELHDELTSVARKRLRDVAENKAGLTAIPEIGWHACDVSTIEEIASLAASLPVRIYVPRCHGFSSKQPFVDIRLFDLPYPLFTEEAGSALAQGVSNVLANHFRGDVLFKENDISVSIQMTDEDKTYFYQCSVSDHNS